MRPDSDALVPLEQLARDAVRDLETHDAALAGKYRRELNAMSRVRIGTIEQPISHAMKLEASVVFLLAMIRDIATRTETSRWDWERIEMIERLVRGVPPA